MKSSRLLAASAALLCGALAAPFADAQSLSFQLFTVPGKSFTAARDFAGDGPGVVGYTLGRRGFGSFVERPDGSVSTVAVPGALQTLVYASRGDKLMGQVQRTLAFSTGFVLDGAGNVQDVTPPDGSDAQVNGMNEAGTVVGTYVPDSGGAEEAGFILRDGVYTRYLLPDSFDTELVAVANDGTLLGNYRPQMTGSHGKPFYGFVDRNGQRKRIHVPGSFDTFVSGFNANGAVVGYYNLPGGSGYTGFFYDGTSFQDVKPVGGTNTYVWHIDDTGRMVGFSYFADGSEASFVATPAK